MANFSPSIHFAKRWLATPAVARKVVYDELNNIIDLLDSDVPSRQFIFRHPDFNQAMNVAMDSNDGNLQPNRLIHSIETTSLSAEQETKLTQVDLTSLEERLNHSLSGQIDEFLSEHTSQLAEDLRAWVQMAVRHELENYQQNQS